MVTRNIVLAGMTGGAGHIGMATQGYGGATASVGISIELSVKRPSIILTKKEKSIRLVERKGIQIKKVR